MDNELNFETFLYISSDKMKIFSNKNYKEKNIYDEELLIEQQKNYLDFEKLDQFLKMNVFELEKVTKNFLENIFLILDLDVFFPIQISVKKNNNGEEINTNNLKYLINYSKDQCHQTLQDKKIIHMIIDKYIIDGKSFSHLPENMKCNYFSLDVSIISLPIDYIIDLERVLKKYHISLVKIISANYMKRLFPDNDQELAYMTRKIIDGHNKNEVLFKSKIEENKGFFERFFNFFN